MPNYNRVVYKIIAAEKRNKSPQKHSEGSDVAQVTRDKFEPTSSPEGRNTVGGGGYMPLKKTKKAEKNL